MTKRTRFLSAILILALFLNIAPPAAAAQADTGRLTMTASAGTVSHGDLVTVRIAADRSFAFRGAGITIAYDPQQLEPVRQVCQSAAPLTISGPMRAEGKTVLRISSFPGEEGHTVGEGEPLAVLAFRTLTPGDDITVEMTAAYFYDMDLNPIAMAVSEPVKLQVEHIPVTGITLGYTRMDLEIGESRALKATIIPANATDKTITWSSSDETKVTVEDGVLTGLAITEEPVTITASAGGCSAECAVSVVYPPDADYVFAMPDNQTVIVNETLLLSPVIDNADALTVFNAYDITLAYDPAMLRLVTTEIPDTTVTKGEGMVNLLHYGPDQSVGTSPFTLSFKALKTGKTTVEVTAARIDHSENAILRNAAKASLYPDTTQITVGGYPVSLPDDFTGETVVEPGDTYTFEARDKLYDYTFEGSTMGGQKVTVKDNGDGTFTVENVSGALVILSQKTGKYFPVYFEGAGRADMKGNSTAQYMTDYSATLEEDDEHVYSVSISVAKEGYRDYQKKDNVFTIPGKDITGEIRFTVSKTKPGDGGGGGGTSYYSVTFEGNGAGAAEGNASTAVGGSSYTFRLNKEAGYRYAVTYTMGGGEARSVRPDEAGIYTIKNVSGDLVITVTREIDDRNFSVEVYNYITLNDGTTMYLVLVRGGLDDSKVNTYADSPMYYSEAYDAWCILTRESGRLTAGLAGSRVGMQSGQQELLIQADCDVNMTGQVDINDAQLVYDLYNSKYRDFTRINMRRFLNADINADRKVTVTDAAAVVSAIK